MTDSGSLGLFYAKGVKEAVLGFLSANGTVSAIPVDHVIGHDDEGALGSTIFKGSEI